MGRSVPLRAERIFMREIAGVRVYCIERRSTMSAKEISMEVVATKILLIRGKKVMLDRDLAKLYGVST